jgi:hypothetical protein
MDYRAQEERTSEQIKEDIKEYIEDCSWEGAAGEAYGHPQYITGFPYFMEDILHLLIDRDSITNADNWTEGRYLILKHAEEIDKNFQKIVSDAFLRENLFKGIKDMENFRDFM